MRKSLARPCKKLTVESCIPGDFDTVVQCEMMPGIINSNQDAEDIWRKIDAVRFPACIKIDDAVSADPAVDEIPLNIGSVAGESGSDHAGISGSESHIIKSFAAAIVSAAIGHGIALKKNSYFFHSKILSKVLFFL